jgi:hypothetical protein
MILLSSELTVVDRTTGELLDLRAASVERLARYMTDLQDLWRELSQLEEAVSDELVRRCDQGALWTLRVNDPETGHQYEVKTQSPAAGAGTYRPDELQHQLNGLVADGTLNTGGAEGALKRTVTVEFAVPWGHDPVLLADALKEAESIQISGVEVHVVKAKGERTPVAAGIAKLRKIPGVAEALDLALQLVEAPRRRAKVTLKGRSL